MNKANLIKNQLKNKLVRSDLIVIKSAVVNWLIDKDKDPASVPLETSILPEILPYLQELNSKWKGLQLQDLSTGNPAIKDFYDCVRNYLKNPVKIRAAIKEQQEEEGEDDESEGEKAVAAKEGEQNEQMQSSQQTCEINFVKVLPNPKPDLKKTLPPADKNLQQLSVEASQIKQNEGAESGDTDKEEYQEWQRLNASYTAYKLKKRDAKAAYKIWKEQATKYAHLFESDKDSA